MYAAHCVCVSVIRALPGMTFAIYPTHMEHSIQPAAAAAPYITYDPYTISMNCRRYQKTAIVSFRVGRLNSIVWENFRN